MNNLLVALEEIRKPLQKAERRLGKPLRKSESRYGKQKGVKENGNFGVSFRHQICYHARAWIYFVDLKYSQFKINHLNDTPSTKAARGRIYSGVLLKDIKVPVKVRRTLSSVGTSSSIIYFKLSTSKSD